jgi:hypothetical protein
MPRKLSRGGRCLNEGILNVLYGLEEAEAQRRRLRMGAKAREAEYTRAALALEAADQAIPPKPCTVPRPVTPADLKALKAELRAELRADVLAEIVGYLKGAQPCTPGR